jgi:DNA-binding beta-propeller fold protein YncE
VGYSAERSSIDAVALHPKGEVHIVDAAQGMILVFDRKLRFVKAFRPPTPAGGRPPRLVDLAFSPDGRSLYVVDGANFRIGVLDEDGNERGGWGRFGGDGADSFREPAGVATDARGFVYVTDRTLNRVKKFDAKGGFVLQWGERGTAQGQFYSPEAIYFHPAGFLVVDDFGNHRGLTFTTVGTQIELISKGGSSGPMVR